MTSVSLQGARLACKSKACLQAGRATCKLTETTGCVPAGLKGEKLACKRSGRLPAGKALTKLTAITKCSSNNREGEKLLLKAFGAFGLTKNSPAWRAHLVISVSLQGAHQPVRARHERERCNLEIPLLLMSFGLSR